MDNKNLKHSLKVTLKSCERDYNHVFEKMKSCRTDFIEINADFIRMRHDFNVSEAKVRKGNLQIREMKSYLANCKKIILETKQQIKMME